MRQMFYKTSRTIGHDPKFVWKPTNGAVDDFNFLFKLLLVGGLSFPPIGVKKRKPSLATRAFEIFINVLSLVVIVINIFLWQKRYSSLALHFTTTLTITLAIVVRFVVYMSWKKVPEVTRNLIQLYDETIYKVPHRSLKRDISVACFLAVSVTVTAATLETYRLHAAYLRGGHSIQFLMGWDDSDQPWAHSLFLCLTPVKMYFAYCVSVLTLIFCCAMYTMANRTTQALDARIRKNCDQLVISSMTIRSYVELYNRLCCTVAEMDKVLSPCVFLLYGLMVSGQFYALSVLISKDTDPAVIPTMLQNVIVFLLTAACFLIMTLSASKVTESGEDLKRTLHKLAEKVTLTSDSECSVLPPYLILVSILNGSYLSFTGWRMFNINRSFILTTMGVMISYGVIVVQLGR